MCQSWHTSEANQLSSSLVAMESPGHPVCQRALTGKAAGIARYPVLRAQSAPI